MVCCCNPQLKQRCPYFPNEKSFLTRGHSPKHQETTNASRAKVNQVGTLKLFTTSKGINTNTRMISIDETSRNRIKKNGGI